MGAVARRVREGSRIDEIPKEMVDLILDQLLLKGRWSVGRLVEQVLLGDTDSDSSDSVGESRGTTTAEFTQR